MVAERPDLKPYAGEDLTVIAWLWARTVASPDPMVRGTHVPLASSFVLSSKKGKEAIVVPVVDRVNGTYRFTVKAKRIEPGELEKARSGTKAGRGANFWCLLSGSPISGDYVKTQGRAGKMTECLMAVVAEGRRERIFLEPSGEMEELAKSVKPKWRPVVSICGSTQYLGIKPYGMDNFDQLFTDRQLVALTTLSDLVSVARKRVLADAIAARMKARSTGLADQCEDVEAYADAVTTYLGLCVTRQVNRGSNLSFWNTARDYGGAGLCTASLANGVGFLRGQSAK